MDTLKIAEIPAINTEKLTQALQQLRSQIQGAYLDDLEAAEHLGAALAPLNINFEGMGDQSGHPDQAKYYISQAWTNQDGSIVIQYETGFAEQFKDMTDEEWEGFVRILKSMIFHELTHRHQIEQVRERYDDEYKIDQILQKWNHEPSQLSRYLGAAHEISAFARETVEEFRNTGYSDEQIRDIIRSTERQKSSAGDSHTFFTYLDFFGNNNPIFKKFLRAIARVLGTGKESSHKTPPLSDTVYPNLDAGGTPTGEGNNAYSQVPERVEGIYEQVPIKDAIKEASVYPWLPLPNFETGMAASFEAYHGGKNWDLSVGVFFTNDPNYAQEYGDIVRYKVSIRNPLVVSDPYELTELLDVDSKSIDKEIKKLREKLPIIKDRIQHPRFRKLMGSLDRNIGKAAIEAGYDSVVVADWHTTEIRVFHQKAIKAAALGKTSGQKINYHKLPILEKENWPDGQIIEWIACPFPPIDRPTGWLTGHAEKQAIIKTVSLSQLHSRQDRVTINGLDKPRDDSYGLPFVVQSNGILFIQDGHHRLSRDFFDGKETAEVRFVSLDEKPKNAGETSIELDFERDVILWNQPPNAVRLDMPVAGGIQSSNHPGFGDCTAQAFAEYKKNQSEVWVGIAIDRKDYQQGLHLYQQGTWHVVGVPHAWNVSKGQILDRSLGSTEAKEHIYFGVQIPPVELNKMRDDGEIAEWHSANIRPENLSKEEKLKLGSFDAHSLDAFLKRWKLPTRVVPISRIKPLEYGNTWEEVKQHFLQSKNPNAKKTPEGVPVDSEIYPYVEAVRNNQPFPPALLLFTEDKILEVQDGHHRVVASLIMKEKDILAVILNEDQLMDRKLFEDYYSSISGGHEQKKKKSRLIDALRVRVLSRSAANFPFQQIHSAKLAIVKELDESDIEWWQTYAQALEFKTQKEAREWIFRRLQIFDQRPEAAMFGIDGPKKNRAKATVMPLHREGNRWKIGRPPKPKVLSWDDFEIRYLSRQELTTGGWANPFDVDHIEKTELPIEEVHGTETTDSSDVQALFETIKTSGKFTAIVVDQDGSIIDGHHRYEVVKMMGLKTIPATIIYFKED